MMEYWKKVTSYKLHVAGDGLLGLLSCLGLLGLLHYLNSPSLLIRGPQSNVFHTPKITIA
jgi:hypothetical protein